MRSSHKLALIGLASVFLILLSGYFSYKAIHTVLSGSDGDEEPAAKSAPELGRARSSGPAPSTSANLSAAESGQPVGEASTSEIPPAWSADTTTVGTPAASEQPPPTTRANEQTSAEPQTEPVQTSLQASSEQTKSTEPTPAITTFAPDTPTTEISATDPPTTPSGSADGPEQPAHFPDGSASELEAWRQFRIAHNRSYPTREESLRRQAIFTANLRFIRHFNERSGALYTLDVNHFADMARDEINQLFVGPQLSWSQTVGQLAGAAPGPMQTLSVGESGSVDWRNLTGPPLDQGNCRAGAVFAALANLESALNKAAAASTGGSARPVKLDERLLMDCLALSAPPGAPPVCAGFTSALLVFRTLEAQQAGSVEPSPPPPQLPEGGGPPPAAEQPRCRPLLLEGGAPLRLNPHMLVHRANFPEALLNGGPLSVALDASQSTFHFYKSGLYHDNCAPDTYNHHALLVGFTSGPPSSFLVRNSFGPDWGESGYMRLLNDEQRNRCLPQSPAIYPNLALE